MGGWGRHLWQQREGRPELTGECQTECTLPSVRRAAWRRECVGVETAETAETAVVKPSRARPPLAWVSRVELLSGDGAPAAADEAANESSAGELPVTACNGL